MRWLQRRRKVYIPLFQHQFRKIELGCTWAVPFEHFKIFIAHFQFSSKQFWTSSKVLFEQTLYLHSRKCSTKRQERVKFLSSTTKQTAQTKKILSMLEKLMPKVKKESSFRRGAFCNLLCGTKMLIETVKSLKNCNSFRMLGVCTISAKVAQVIDFRIQN